MLTLWLHVLAATVWIGSQVMMFAVVVPSLRAAGDEGARWRVLESVTRRFGLLGAGALLLLVLTGIDNVIRYPPEEMFDYHYGYILTVKLVMVVLVVGLAFVHTRIVGPRLLEAQRPHGGRGGTAAEVAALRQQSMVVSSLTLLLSVAILFCAVLLRSSFALEPA